MSEEINNTEKQSSNSDSEVLVEKVREIETAKKAATTNNDQENTAKILRERLNLSPPMDKAEAKKLMANRSRRTFLIGGAAALAGVFGWRWMPDAAKNALLTRTFR
ncbi:MAG: hypothetical protein ACR2GD_07095, partial [Pyrinomonadaceae bacterium]